MIAAMSASLLGSLLSGEACTPGPQVELKWNAHASEWGAYTITGCDGVNPKLSIAAGTTYTFDQSHASNWCATRPPAARSVSTPAPCSASPARPHQNPRFPNC